MMRTARRLLIAVIMAAGVWATAGSSTPAQAYCEAEPVATTSSCSNSCTRSAEAWEKLTGREAPWLCPM